MASWKDEDGKEQSLKPNHGEFNPMRSLDWVRKRNIMMDFQMCSSLRSLGIKFPPFLIPYTPRSSETDSGKCILACPKERCCLQIADTCRNSQERNTACVLLLEMLSLIHYVSQPWPLWPTLVALVAIPVMLLSLCKRTQRTCHGYFEKVYSIFCLAYESHPNHSLYSK